MHYLVEEKNGLGRVEKDSMAETNSITADYNRGNQGTISGQLQPHFGVKTTGSDTNKPNTAGSTTTNVPNTTTTNVPNIVGSTATSTPISSSCATSLENGGNSVKKDSEELVPMVVYFKEGKNEKESGESIYVESNSSYMQVRKAITEQWELAPKHYFFINEIGVRVNDKQEKFAAFKKQNKIILQDMEEKIQNVNNDINNSDNNEDDQDSNFKGSDEDNDDLVISELPLNTKKRRQASNNENKPNKKINTRASDTKERCGKPTNSKDHHPCQKYKPCPFHTDE